MFYNVFICRSCSRYTKSAHCHTRLQLGVISRVAQGAEPLNKISVHWGGEAEPPQKLFYGLCSSKCSDFASEVFSISMINYALLHGY